MSSQLMHKSSETPITAEKSVEGTRLFYKKLRISNKQVVDLMRMDHLQSLNRPYDKDVIDKPLISNRTRSHILAGASVIRAKRFD